jgi:hypothetical protein
VPDEHDSPAGMIADAGDAVTTVGYGTDVQLEQVSDE